MSHLLFSYNISSQYIYLAIDFLFTRVLKTKYDDWVKIKQHLKYILGSINLPLILREDDLKTLKFYLNTSYTIREDWKVHTGVILKMGRGAMISIPKKHNLIQGDPPRLRYSDSTMWCHKWCVRTTLHRPKDKNQRPSCTRTTWQPCCWKEMVRNHQSNWQNI